MYNKIIEQAVSSLRFCALSDGDSRLRVCQHLVRRLYLLHGYCECALYPRDQIECFKKSLAHYYSTQGGIKAVVWTDTIQIFIIYGSIITVLIKGTLDLGGLGIVFERNLDSRRIEFFKSVPNPCP